MSNLFKSAGNYLKEVAQAAGGLVAAVVPIFEEEAETLVKTEATAYLPAVDAAKVEAAANTAITDAGAKALAETVTIPTSLQAVTSPTPELAPVSPVAATTS